MAKPEKWESLIAKYGERYKEFAGLSDRETVILIGAILDVALVELLVSRMRGPDQVYRDFFGIDGSANAPCSSFGARIQLGELLAVLTREDAEVLFNLNALRSDFAHRVQVSFVDKAAMEKLQKVILAFRKRGELAFAEHKAVFDASGLDSAAAALRNDPGGAKFLLLTIFEHYQAYLKRAIEQVDRLKTCAVGSPFDEDLVWPRVE